jgi:hypothetical protein
VIVQPVTVTFDRSLDAADEPPQRRIVLSDTVTSDCL